MFKSDNRVRATFVAFVAMLALCGTILPTTLHAQIGNECCDLVVLIDPPGLNCELTVIANADVSQVSWREVLSPGSPGITFSIPCPNGVSVDIPTFNSVERLNLGETKFLFITEHCCATFNYFRDPVTGCNTLHIMPGFCP
ncbi:MAG: hypothetical protein AB7H80_10800 [Candidatus Kapaibacterium sp.]